MEIIFIDKQKWEQWEQKNKRKQQQRRFRRAFDSLLKNNDKSAAYIRGILRSVEYSFLYNGIHNNGSDEFLLKKLFIYGFIRYKQNCSDLEQFTTTKVEKYAESDGISRIRNCYTFAYNLNLDQDIRDLNKSEKQTLNSYLQNAGLSSLAN